MTRKYKRIGIALGGGGARGFAHLGILRALKRAGLTIDVYAGTSMGAIIAVAHQQSRSFRQAEGSLKDFVIEYASRFRNMDYMETASHEEKGISLSSVLSALGRGLQIAASSKKLYLEDGKLVLDIAEHFIHPCKLEELPKPVLVCTLDMITGQGVFLREGNAQKAIQAAMSIAGYFPGVPLGERLLYDAQAVFPVPIQAFQHEPVDYIIASEVGNSIQSQYEPRNALDLLFRQHDLLYSHVASELDYCSDCVIRPELDDIHWTDFHKLDLILRRGLEAGEKAIPGILAALPKARAAAEQESRPWHRAGYKDGNRTALDHFPEQED